MSWKLFTQIVLLIIIAAFVMVGARGVSNALYKRGLWKCPWTGTKSGAPMMKEHGGMTVK